MKHGGYATLDFDLLRIQRVSVRAISRWILGRKLVEIIQMLMDTV